MNTTNTAKRRIARHIGLFAVLAGLLLAGATSWFTVPFYVGYLLASRITRRQPLAAVGALVAGVGVYLPTRLLAEIGEPVINVSAEIILVDPWFLAILAIFDGLPFVLLASCFDVVLDHTLSTQP